MPFGEAGFGCESSPPLLARDDSPLLRQTFETEEFAVTFPVYQKGRRNPQPD